MPLKVGDKAPAFSGQDVNKQTVSLDDYLAEKHVFLVFYPSAFSPVCSIQLSNYNRNLDGFQNRNTEVITISVDSTWSQKAFCDTLGGIDFPMISDMKLEIAGKYGVALPGGLSTRAEFLIDKDGIIRWLNIEESPGDDTPTIEEIFDAIDQL